MASMNFEDPEVAKFLDQTYQLLKEDALQKGTDREYPVMNFKHPNELKSLLDLDITAGPATYEQLLEEMKRMIQYSPKPGHPHYHDPFYGSLDAYSQAGSWLSSSLNVNLHTFEISPVFIVLEKYIFKKLCDLVGFQHGDGMFCPGGTNCNFFGLHLARFKKFPEVKKTGMFSLPTLRCYISEDGHHSLLKAVNYLGFGGNSVVPVSTDDRGRMLVSDLESSITSDIEKGYMPLMVMATCGSTVLGSFDDLTAISKVCKTYNIWLHADANWGGGVAASKQHRHLLKGSHLCDSLTWNLHQLNGLPEQCSVFLINDPTGNALEEANSARAEYLFQPDKHYDISYDSGDKTVQCGRKSDVVKLWMQWRALGDSGIEARIDQAFENARYLTEKLRTNEGFKLVLPEFECTNVCFWYIPHRLRGQLEDNKWWQEIGKIAPKIKERMTRTGSLLIQYQPMSNKGFVNFFRAIIHNPLCRPRDMDFIVEEIERLGHDL
ncbi:glutamate decarboxylase protein [Plakobranchus ocellatus]|uniref:Glutamate decarboxylase protein n=1 Tax=Plakobranchus ocellatus TaxID=259542 RepID=A0AAV3ZIZ0_9GAST|nr:glutamate decarboxylase protein [Plakobranchus ocellatus]